MTRSVRALIVTGVIAALAAACGSPGGRTADGSDPRALEIADRVMAALGGKKRWNDLRYVSWTFQVSVNDTLRPPRRHLWDKHIGWHRVEGTNRAGQTFRYVANLRDTTGRAWVAGVEIHGDSLAPLMRNAHAAWINDSYWFLMPYKLRDPGVTLRYEGERQDSTGAVFDRLALSFAGVGITPGDRYWVEVNRANDRVERWEHLLQGAEPPAVPWTWEGWEEHGGLWFPTAHRNDGRIIFTRDVALPARLTEQDMEAPAP